MLELAWLQETTRKGARLAELRLLRRGELDDAGLRLRGVGAEELFASARVLVAGRAVDGLDVPLQGRLRERAVLQ
eukprot:5187991-Alexandrium_andersonii.AAC.1